MTEEQKEQIKVKILVSSKGTTVKDIMIVKKDNGDWKQYESSMPPKHLIERWKKYQKDHENKK